MLLPQLYQALRPAYYKLGCPHNLPSTALPDGAQRIIDSWISESFHALRLNPFDATPRPNFLTDVMQLCDLHTFALGSGVPEYLNHLPWISQEGPEWLVRKPGVNILSDLVRFTARGPQALTSGILFLK